MKTFLALLSIAALLACAASYGQQTQIDSDDIRDNSDESAEITSACYGNGKIKSDNPCSLCYCRNGKKSCTRISCNQMVPRNCQEVKEEGKCCPVIKCPEISPPVQKPDYQPGEDNSECRGNGPITSDNPCSICFCRNGKKSCTRQSCDEAVPRGCKKVNVPGKCCPEIDCPEISPPEQPTGYQPGDVDAECRGTGPIFSDNPCSICFCRNGKKSCTRQSCDQAVPRGCKEVKIPGKCCPEINCPEISPPNETPRDDPSDYSNLMTTRPPTECTGDGPLPSPNSCTTCRCKKGSKSCISIRCRQEFAPPNCAVKRFPGECCPRVVCNKPDEKPVDIGSITGCDKDGPKPSSDPCNKCYCRYGNLRCTKTKCPPIEPGCVAKRNPGQCCPKVECSGTKY